MGEHIICYKFIYFLTSLLKKISSKMIAVYVSNKISDGGMAAEFLYKHHIISNEE